jgi:small subunit ribosomal protein S15
MTTTTKNTFAAAAASAAAAATTSAGGNPPAAPSATPASDSSSSPPPAAPCPRPDLVEVYLSDDVLCSRRGALQKGARKRQAIAQFARQQGDVGSPEVQVALATERIRDLAEHFRQHRKDHHSRRGLQALLNRRRKLLAYLRDSDFERFCGVMAALGLERDTYAKQARADSYRTGSALGGASAERLPRVALTASAARRRAAVAAKKQRKRRGGGSGGGRKGGGAAAAAAAAAAATGRPRATGAPMA